MKALSFVCDKCSKEISEGITIHSYAFKPIMDGEEIKTREHSFLVNRKDKDGGVRLFPDQLGDDCHLCKECMLTVIDAYFLGKEQDDGNV